MDGKIRVYNNTKHDVGVYLLDLPNIGHNIRPGTFIFMTEADIEYLMATTRLFENGELKPEEKGTEVLLSGGIDVKTNPNFADDDEIKKKLGMSAKKIEEWLNTIDNAPMLDRICDVADAMNLPASKLKVLQAKMPEREFI